MEMVKDNKENNPYFDIINLTRPISTSHERMSHYNRAAQFSPFAAVVGYDGAIKETARLTDQKIELDESEKIVLSERLNIVQEKLSKKQDVGFTYFQSDEKKTGGEYRCLVGVVKKIDEYERAVVMEDGTRIAIEEIVEISGKLFKEMDGFFF